jgi:hypothetical protein
VGIGREAPSAPFWGLGVIELLHAVSWRVGRVTERSKMKPAACRQRIAPLRLEALRIQAGALCCKRPAAAS